MAEWYRSFLGSAFLSDVLLECTDKVRIPAHKIVLAAASLTFRNMFSPGFDEAASPVIAVPYLADDMRVLLEFMYCGRPTQHLSDVAVLLDGASYFALDELKDHAVEILRQQTTGDNVLSMLRMALSHNSTALRDHCITLIRQHNLNVLHSDQWLLLSLNVALLLLEETVIDGELAVLVRAGEWVAENSGPDEAEGHMAAFLAYVDFTSMHAEEVKHAESMPHVPLKILYEAFKCHSLGLQPTHMPRKGGIILQWEMGAPDIAVSSNHATKSSLDYQPKTVRAINKFTKGRHYWTVTVVDFRTQHDCLIGVSHKSLPLEYQFEPCCMTVCSPPGTNVTKDPLCPTSVLHEHTCVIGVLLDFDDNRIQWFNHTTKQLMFTASTTGLGDDGQKRALPTPLYPSATLYHKGNGGVVLSEATTYLNERVVASPTKCALKTPTKRTTRRQ